MFFRKKKDLVGKSAQNPSGKGFSAELLRDISRNFAITDEIELSPEYIQELELKSIVIGFLVNKRTIYGMDDVTWDDETQTIAFHSRDGDKRISQVEEFSLLLPLNNSDDRKMAYHRKEELSRVGLFKRGNTITVTAMGGGRRSYSIDGVVTSYMRLKEGLFANHEVAVLSLDPSTFKVSERRRHQRLLTNVPATIRSLKGDRNFDCRLIDYVEEAARFDVTTPAALEILGVGKAVSVTIEMAEIERRYQLEGTVQKVEGHELVVGFRNIHKNGAFTPFSELDSIEIKAMLQKVAQARAS